MTNVQHRTPARDITPLVEIGNEEIWRRGGNVHGDLGDCVGTVDEGEDVAFAAEGADAFPGETEAGEGGYSVHHDQFDVAVVFDGCFCEADDFVVRDGVVEV
jgi:hypothetical protein